MGSGLGVDTVGVMVRPVMVASVTVRSAVPVTLPWAAVMVAEPGATPVARPSTTVAVPVAELLQVVVGSRVMSRVGPLE
jgi:uncharacterized membrane protein